MNLRKHIILLYFGGFLLFSWLLNNFVFLNDYSDSRYSLHTITEIHVLSRNKFQAIAALDTAYQRIKDLEKKLNYFDTTSEISILNARAYYEPVQVSDDTIHILQKALTGSKESKGAFDITSTPITKLYGFGTEEKHIPGKAQLKNALTSVGYQYIQLDPEKQTVRFLKKGLMIDLGGILKGYAVDEAVAVLRAHGIKNALVNGGGNIYALGKNRGKPWKIGIRDPKDPDNTRPEYLELSNNACATSGDYEQFFVDKGRKISHIFNPHSGLPSNLENGIRAVTVVAPDACAADVLSTSCFVLGPENSEKLFPNIKKIFYKI